MASHVFAGLWQAVWLYRRRTLLALALLVSPSWPR